MCGTHGMLFRAEGDGRGRELRPFFLYKCGGELVLASCKLPVSKRAFSSAPFTDHEEFPIPLSIVLKRHR